VPGKSSIRKLCDIELAAIDNDKKNLLTEWKEHKIQVGYVS